MIILYIFEHIYKISKNAQAVVNNRISKIGCHPTGSVDVCNCPKFRYLSGEVDGFPCSHTVATLQHPHNVKIHGPIPITSFCFPCYKINTFITQDRLVFDLRNLTARQKEQKELRLQMGKGAVDSSLFTIESTCQL